MRRLSLFFLFLSLFTRQSAAQTIDYASHKEKIYLQTSHVFLKPGDDVFFKIYLVNAQDNTPATISSIVYVDVIAPSGTVAQQCLYRVENGYAEGVHSFSPDAAGGIYKLKAYTSWMKNETDSTFFTKDLVLQKVISPRILMKLDFPQKGYGPGDEVTADFSARNLDDKPIPNHSIKYTVSIGGKEQQENTLQTDGAGKAKIRFRLPPGLSTTDGLLNITVTYDAYTEAISRSIPIVLNKVSLALLPEGGTLVAGQPANIAFRAVNESGKPVDVAGIVQDNSGQTVARLESYHNGMGQFRFTPAAGHRYEVVLSAPAGIIQRFAVPPAATRGLSFQVTAGKGQLSLHLHASNAADVIIAGYTKERQYFLQNVALRPGTQTVTIDPAIFPAGIARFTVMERNGLPLAERVMFLHPEKMLRVNITPDKMQYNPREKVLLKIKTLDEQGFPIPSNFSLAVVDDKLWTFADDRQDHIISWLMMSSELKGKIDNPQFYFRKGEAKAPAALDLVMLTHGYRYFDYIPFIERDNKLRYLPDEQNIIQGTVLNAQKQGVPARLWLINMYDGTQAIQVTTGPDGAFYFPGLRPGTQYYIIAQALKKKEPIEVRIGNNGIGSNTGLQYLYSVTKPDTTRPHLMNRQQQEADLIARRRELPTLPGEKFSRRQLDEVVVIAYGEQRKKNLSGSVVRISGKELSAAPLQDALNGQLAGITTVRPANPGQGANITIRGTNTISGNNTPLIIFDGIPVDKLEGINPNDIESVHILKENVAAALYGARAYNGVIIIESKRQGDVRIKWQHKPVSYFGFQSVHLKNPAFTPVRRFSAPQYGTDKATDRTDFRETIYWNPVIQTDKNGEAEVSFYNSDATTTFRAIAEGIGYNGKAGRAETTYTVQNMLSLDAKIPPYLTVGDNARIPLHIRNNYSMPLQATIKAELAESIKAGVFNKTVQLAAGESTVVYVPVTAASPVTGTMRFTVSTQQHTESIVLPITVEQKGFPVITTFAGLHSARHTFTLDKIIPGSLQYNLQLFRNPEGQLLDGIASMLREPYGCFEQTSSATYPNIFILKYLREAGKSNPEIESKAMRYIEKGYKRLTGFETAGGGFEWFGKTPPHEALTAYGLMEFTDMAAFIPVDKQMLQRTKDFLLKRRNGNGGFKLSTEGYDRFATVPNKIADLYIVYAFSHAGYGAEVMREYEHVLSVALKSDDAYQLSMMALTAHNVGRTFDFSRLMAQLGRHYRQKTFRSETSVVNSRSTSLEVETNALYLLALARDQQPDLVVMAELLSRITSAKSYFGYSSTQATVLALRAVIAYARAAGEAAAETDIRFLLNNQTVMPGNIPPPATPVAENTFSVTYAQSGKVPYNMEVSYATFTPPNSPQAALRLHTSLSAPQVRVGGTLRMQVSVKNEQPLLQAMSIAKIGIPAGLGVQAWQLKELMEKNQVAYYEMFDNYLVLYWMGFTPGETKTLGLDLKAEIPGTYRAKASNTGLYYMPEYKHWNDGLEAEVLP